MLKFWELAPSPNSVKVRMALRFKGIPFEAIAVNPMDRTPLISLSGQELAPVIEQDGVVLNDSEAILHFLDANHSDRPRLIPPDRTGRRTCDQWKATLDEKVARPWFPIFSYGLGFTESLDASAVPKFHEALQWLESQLLDSNSFHGPDRPICDLRAAEWAVYALPSVELMERVPLFRKLETLYGVEKGSFSRLESFLEPWHERSV